MKKATRSLLLAVAASAMLLPVSASDDEEVYERRSVHMRAGVLADSSVVASTDSPTTPATSAQPATSVAATSSASATSATSAAAPTGASSSPAAQTTATKGASSAPPSATTQAVTSSAVATTDSSGQVVTSFIEFTPTPSSTAPSQTNTGTSSSGDGGGGGGLGTGSIIGLSVAGGIAAIAIILFFVWKFTRKRFADFDDNEAIKWPELNAHNTDVHALPTNATGRAGFGPENDSDVNLTRAPSPGAYANSITASVPEAYGAGDPYAVPPLPHLNPNQPYHDEPGAYGQPAGYYDPYQGPVPNTFGDSASDGFGAESIPMTQMARMKSPSPQVIYDMQGRGSPAPQAVMGYPGLEERSRTPTSVAVSAGRASPGPNPGYGYGPR